MSREHEHSMRERNDHPHQPSSRGTPASRFKRLLLWLPLIALLALAGFGGVTLAQESADDSPPDDITPGRVFRDARGSKLQPSQDLPSLEELEARGGLNYRYQDRLTRALDKDAPNPSRLRAINSLGHYGDARIAEQLRTGLDGEEPEIRIATMRALMRLGVAQAEPDLRGIFRAAESTGAERAWALRALGRSDDPQAQIPDLIEGLDSTEPGVRAASLDSLRRLTGLTQGAKSTLLLPAPDAEEQAELAERWKRWWDENEGSSPEEWRFDALDAEMPIDRAAAARRLAAEGDPAAIPHLLKRFAREGNYLLGGKLYSGVREALSNALQTLTGMRMAYRPTPDPEETLNEWMVHHGDVYRAYKTAYEERFTGEGSGWLVLLQAENPLTRADALRSMRSALKLGQHPLKRYLIMLTDDYSQVREEAHANLVAATGVAWPFDAAGEERLRELQIARWSDWLTRTKLSDAPTSRFGDQPSDDEESESDATPEESDQPESDAPSESDQDGNQDAESPAEGDSDESLDESLKEEASEGVEAEDADSSQESSPTEPDSADASAPDQATLDQIKARILSVFQPVKDQTWGLTAATSQTERENMIREMRSVMIGVRSQAARFIVQNALKPDPELLLESFAQQVRATNKVLRDGALSPDRDVRPATGLQANLARALGSMRHQDALPWLLRSLELDAASRRYDLPHAVRRVCTDATVRMTVVAAIGELGVSSIEVRAALRPLIQAESEDESLRVRIQALYALARCGEPQDMALMNEVLVDDDFLRSAHEKIAAAESIGMLAERLPQARERALEYIERAILTMPSSAARGRVPLGQPSDADPVKDRAEYVRAVLIQLERERIREARAARANESEAKSDTEAEGETQTDDTSPESPSEDE